MDYKVFYSEVADWIGQANQMAMQHGMDNPDFWQWVADSSGEMCNKYQNSPLVKKQMMMLVDWLEEAYEKKKTNSN